ncbi:hypothetical protein GCM10007927_09530 [Sulfitobacter pacificus]|uniref:Uncharacterized protein n=1 Tax=Sulfitobacter pacificus TaxID=1499314 RepID=A0ABQ5VGD0_9RHOB|nr:hypothetical protein GCM10007927_09530 [Sulfitobacter pacificus]
MHRIPRQICLLMMLVILSGCFGLGQPQTKGRGAAILDAAMPEARAHAIALAGDDMAAARRSGVRLLAILKQWVE